MDIRDLIRQALTPLTVSQESEPVVITGSREHLDLVEDLLETDDELLAEIDDSTDEAAAVAGTEAVVQQVDDASVNTAELADALATAVAEGGFSAESLTFYNTALDNLIRAHRLPLATESFQVSVEDFGSTKTRLECSTEAMDKAVELFKRFWEGLKRVVKEFIQKVVAFVRTFKEVGQKIRKAGVALQDGIKTIEGKTAAGHIPNSANKAWTSALFVGGDTLLFKRPTEQVTPVQALDRLNTVLSDMVIGYPAAVFHAVSPVIRALQQKKPFVELQKTTEKLQWDYKGKTLVDVPGCKCVWIDDKNFRNSTLINLENLSRRAARVSPNEETRRLSEDATTLSKQDLTALARDLIRTGESIATLERETREFDKIVNEFMKAGDTYTKEAAEAGWAKGEVKAVLSQLRSCITHQASFMAVYLPYMAGICRNLYQYGTYSIAAYR